jgi:hypothetical protein
MAFQFPASPTLGQTFTPVAGVGYKWNGTGWSPLGPQSATLNPDGTVGAPGISWINEPSAGFFRAGANYFQSVVSGNPVFAWNATSFAISTGMTFNVFGPARFADGTLAAPGIGWGSEPALGFYRSGAGQISVAGSIATPDLKITGNTGHTSRWYQDAQYIFIDMMAGGAYWRFDKANRHLIWIPGFGNNTTFQADGTLNIGNSLTTVGHINAGFDITASRNLATNNGYASITFSPNSPTVTDQLALRLIGSFGGGLTFYDGALRSAIWTQSGQLVLGTGGGGSGIPIKLYIEPTQILSSVNALKPGGGPWSDSSDARIKTVLGAYGNGLAAIKQINPVRYEFKGNYSTSLEPATQPVHAQALRKEFIGVLAQEIEVPMPETVTLTTGYIDGEKVDDVRVLDTNALTYALINAVKELALRVEELEAAP